MWRAAEQRSVPGESLTPPAPAAGAVDASPGRASRLGRWLREPLLHFLLIGLALFVAYRALNPDAGARSSSNEIVITPDDLRQMSVTWMAQGRPPLTAEQWASLIEAKVREEILFREALALGLDKNDTIVKRRMVQKMEFLARTSRRSATPHPRS